MVASAIQIEKFARSRASCDGEFLDHRTSLSELG
jgi:hypothetical protein